MASKVLIWSGVGIMLAGTAAWLGTAFIGSNATADSVSALQTLPMVTSGQISIGKQEHNKGFFSSNGVLEITIPSVTLADGKPPLTVTTVYEVAHLPLPTGSNRATLQSEIRGLGLDEVLGQPLRINGTATTGLMGAVNIALQSQDVQVNNNGTHVTVAPLQLDIECQRQACREIRDIRYKMALPSLTAQDDNKARSMDIKDVSVNGLLQDAVLQTGSATLDVGSVLTKQNDRVDLSATKLHITSDATEKENRYNAAAKISLATLETEEYKGKDLALNYHIDGLLSTPLRQVMELYNGSNGFTALSDEQAETLNRSLSDMLRGGFSFGIDTVSGSVVASDGQSAHWMGSLSGNLSAAATDTPVALHSQLSSNGSIKVTGNAAEPFAQLSPLLKPIPDGFEAAYTLKDGELTVSDQPFPAPLVRGILAELDQSLNRLSTNGPSADDWRQAFAGGALALPDEMGN